MQQNDRQLGWRRCSRDGTYFGECVWPIGWWVTPLSGLRLRLVTVGDSTRTERLSVQEPQRMDAHMLKYTRPLPKGERKYKKAELIYQAMLKQRVCQLPDAVL